MHRSCSNILLSGSWYDILKYDFLFNEIVVFFFLKGLIPFNPAHEVPFSRFAVYKLVKYPEWQEVPRLLG